MEAARTNDFLLCKRTEDTGHDLKRGFFVRFFESVVLGDLLPVVADCQLGLKLTQDTRDVLAHIKLSSDLFLSTELHDQVLITCLPLPDGIAETELIVDMSE